MVTIKGYDYYLISKEEAKIYIPSQMQKIIREFGFLIKNDDKNFNILKQYYEYKNMIRGNKGLVKASQNTLQTVINAQPENFPSLEEWASSTQVCLTLSPLKDTYLSPVDAKRIIQIYMKGFNITYSYSPKELAKKLLDYFNEKLRHIPRGSLKAIETY